jgi:CheY-like chemotaxis protein
MTTRSTARVLIIDNDPRVGPDLKAILEPAGYHVQVAQGVGQDLVDQATVLAQSFRPHVAIVDVRLLDEYSDDRSGLALLKGLQSARCILYSAYLKPEVTREARYGATSWVSKGESPQRLLDEVARAARETCREDLRLHRPPDLSSQRIMEALFGPDSDVPDDVADDVLGQLFPENEELRFETLGAEVATPRTVPQGRSIVLKVYADDLEPVVAKLAPAKRIRDEERNYQEHVRGRLIGQFYAQLERTAEFWDLGGATYSFLGSSLNTLPSFTDFYRNEKDPQVILRPLAHFFQEVWGKHYAQPLQERSIPLFQAYDQALRLKERLENLRGQEEKLAFPGVPISATNPVSWVLRHADDSLFPEVRHMIIHGNLYGDNLFVDREHAWAIDFEFTGLGPILRDFVSFELDIITRLVPWPEDNFQQLYELTVMLTAPISPAPILEGLPGVPGSILKHPEAAKALMVIAGLRRLAREVTNFRDIREYYWGLLLSVLITAAVTPAQYPQHSRALFLSVVLTERLRQFGQEWPPGNWSPVEIIRLREKAGLRLRRDRLQSRLVELREQAAAVRPQLSTEQIAKLQDEVAKVDLELSLHQLWHD